MVQKGEVLIRISEESKKALDDLKVHPRETYADTVQRLLEKASGLKWLWGLRELEKERPEEVEVEK